MATKKKDLVVGEFAKFLITPKNHPIRYFGGTHGVQIIPIRTLTEGFLGSRRIQPYKTYMVCSGEYIKILLACVTRGVQVVYNSFTVCTSRFCRHGVHEGHRTVPGKEIWMNSDTFSMF